MSDKVSLLVFVSELAFIVLSHFVMRTYAQYYLFTTASYITSETNVTGRDAGM